jgi:hypothetical protein
MHNYFENWMSESIMLSINICYVGAWSIINIFSKDFVHGNACLKSLCFVQVYSSGSTIPRGL